MFRTSALWPSCSGSSVLTCSYASPVLEERGPGTITRPLKNPLRHDIAWRLLPLNLLHLSAIVRQVVEQLTNGALQHRMPDVGCNFGQRLQNEASLVHGGMRNLQLRYADHGIAEQQDVDIDGARAFGQCAPPAHLLLDGEDLRQENFRHQLGAQRDRAIQEPGLRRELHRLGLVER